MSTNEKGCVLQSSLELQQNTKLSDGFRFHLRKSSIRTNLRDLMFLGPTTGLHKQAMTSLHPKVWPGCGNNDAILHREVVIGQATSSPLLNDDLRTYIIYQKSYCAQIHLLTNRLHSPLHIRGPLSSLAGCPRTLTKVAPCLCVMPSSSSQSLTSFEGTNFLSDVAPKEKQTINPT